MSTDMDIEAVSVTPESPVRLRECLSALARHSGCNVLRFEVGLGPSTKGDGSALTMIVTHSLGPEHEMVIAPKLADAFAAVLHALALDADLRAAQATSTEDQEKR